MVSVRLFLRSCRIFILFTSSPLSDRAQNLCGQCLEHLCPLSLIQVHEHGSYTASFGIFDSSEA